MERRRSVQLTVVMSAPLLNGCCTSSLGRQLLLSEVSEKKRYEKGRRGNDKDQEEKRGRSEKERVE